MDALLPCTGQCISMHHVLIRCICCILWHSFRRPHTITYAGILCCIMGHMLWHLRTADDDNASCHSQLEGMDRERRRGKARVVGGRCTPATRAVHLRSRALYPLQRPTARPTAPLQRAALHTISGCQKSGTAYRIAALRGAATCPGDPHHTGVLLSHPKHTI